MTVRSNGFGGAATERRVLGLVHDCRLARCVLRTSGVSGHYPRWLSRDRYLRRTSA
jgi:hypothetical protein